MSFAYSPASDREALLALNGFLPFGNRNVLKLISHYGSATRVFEAPVDEVITGLGLSLQVAAALRGFSFRTFVDNELALFSKTSTDYLTISDELYPARLRTISDAPAVLYLSNKLPTHITHSLAIVGARNATLYGLELAERFARELAEVGIPVVSGLARGIDAAAHRGSLKAGGDTVGVLGCGLDVIYPKENARLFEEVRQKGCLVSEFPFGMQPLPFNFPRRNRIVSGLTLGTIVVEARVKSGALITADFAMEQGREVFAVPGRVDNNLSEGPFALIKQGARLVRSVQDILEELPLSFSICEKKDVLEKPDSMLLTDEERDLLFVVKHGPLSVDELAIKTGRAGSALMALLVGLQIKKKVRELPGKIYELFKK